MPQKCPWCTFNSANGPSMIQHLLTSHGHKIKQSAIFGVFTDDHQHVPEEDRVKAYINVVLDNDLAFDPYHQDLPIYCTKYALEA